MLRTMLLSFTHLSSPGPPGQNFYAFKLLISFSVSHGQVSGLVMWGVAGLDKDK